MTPSTAEELLQNALEIPFHGWDLSLLGDRLVLEPPPWSFERIVDDEAVRAGSMLDMGTGGGEWLSQRRHPARRYFDLLLSRGLVSQLVARWPLADLLQASS